MEVKFIPTEQLKEKPDENALGFGNYFTDYMFTICLLYTSPSP